MRCGFIKAHRGEFGPIGKACGILRVSKSEYYDYLNKPKSNARVGREALEGFAVEKLEPRKGRYGYRRISREPRRDGMAASEKRVLAAMRGLGLRAKGAARRHGRAKPAERGNPRASPIDRAFDVDAGKQALGRRHRPYRYRRGPAPPRGRDRRRHRRVVGRSISDGITERLAADALGQAVGREGPPDDFSLAFRDDQGSRYTSRASRRRLESHGMAQSMSRPGNPWDSAVVEPFFKTLRRELVNDRGCKSRDEARQEAFKYIEPYCNGQRLHSKDGYMAPCGLERDAA